MLFVFAFSCSAIDQTKPLQGSWQCVAWTVEDGTSPYDIEHTSFLFKKNEYYEAVISGHAEKGTFYRQEDKLYTTADGNAKVMTLIKKMTPDTLILGMNRSGIMEEMVLVKKI